MSEPPVDPGAVHVALTSIGAPPAPRAAVTLAGTPGTVAGTTVLDDAENALVPIALVDATVNVYVVPLVNPAIVVLFADPVTVTLRTVTPAILTRMADPVMGEPPFEPWVQD